MSQRITKCQINCDEVCQNISAIHDGEVLTLPHSQVTVHLLECAACRSYQLALPRLFNQMRDDAGIGCDADRVWISVVERITSEETQSEGVFTSSRLKCTQPADASGPIKRIKHWVASLSIAASVMFCVVGAGLLMSLPDELHSAVLVTELVRDFEEFENQGRVFDVDDSGNGGSISWITSKVDFSLPAAIGTPSGYTTAGVRLCSLFGKQIAFIQYVKDQQDTFSVYVLKAERIDLPEGGARLTGKTPDGMTTVAWKEGELGYVVISDHPVESVLSLVDQSQSKNQQ